MSTKIQILNEKQVDHFVDTLLPKLVAKFNTTRDNLREQAKNEKDNFATHAEVVKLKTEHEDALRIGRKTIDLYNELKELDDKFYISRSGWGKGIITTEKELAELKKQQVEELDELLVKLSEENLFVNETWQRRERMTDELRARLSMTAVDEFDNIEKVIMEAININSFFETKLTNN